MPKARAGPKGWAGNLVKPIDSDAAGVQGLTEFTAAGTELEGVFAGKKERRQGAEEPAGVAHDAIDQAQVAAAVDGVRMTRRERIEDFWLELAKHRESKVARRRKGVQCAAQFHP